MKLGVSHKVFTNMFELKGLNQNSSVREYHDSLHNVLGDWFTTASMAIVVSLRPESNVHEAYCLARLHEFTMKTERVN